MRCNTAEATKHGSAWTTWWLETTTRKTANTRWELHCVTLILIFHCKYMSSNDTWSTVTCGCDKMNSHRSTTMLIAVVRLVHIFIIDFPQDQTTSWTTFSCFTIQLSTIGWRKSFNSRLSTFEIFSLEHGKLFTFFFDVVVDFSSSLFIFLLTMQKSASIIYAREIGSFWMIYSMILSVFQLSHSHGLNSKNIREKICSD